MRYRLLIIIPLLALFIYSSVGSCGHTDQLQEMYENTSLADLARKGDMALKAQDPDSALIYFSLSTGKLNDKMPDSLKKICAKAFASKGYTYLFYKNDYAMSYASYLKALDVIDNINDSTLYPEIYLNLGNIFFDYKEEDKMLDYYRKAFRSSVTEKDWRTLRITFASFLAMAISANDVAKYSEEISIFDGLKLPDTKEFRSLSFQRDAVKALTDSDFVKAISCLRQAKEESDMGLIQNRYGVLCDMQIADILNHNGKHDEAIATIRQILSHDGNEIDIQQTALKMLSNSYSYKNDSDSTLKYLRLSTSLSDSLFKSQQYGLIRDIGLNHDVTKLDSRIKIIETEKNATRLALTISCAALAIIITLTVIVFLQNRNLRQRNIDLFKHNSQAMEREAKERALRSLYEKQIEELSAMVNTLRKTKTKKLQKNRRSHRKQPKKKPQSRAGNTRTAI